RRILRDALETSDGTLSGAAALLRVPLSALREYLSDVRLSDLARAHVDAPAKTSNLSELGARRAIAARTGLKADWDAYEKLVRDAVAQAGGNVSRAARILGVSVRTMQR